MIHERAEKAMSTTELQATVVSTSSLHSDSM